jgi:dTDP-4-dehydrorhamnose reductase
MGQPSWHEFAQVVLAEAVNLGAELRVRPHHVAAVRTDACSTRAHRPANSRLATDKLRNTFRVSLPDWRERVTFVREIVVPQLP